MELDNESTIGQDGAVESLPDGWSRVEESII